VAPDRWAEIERIYHEALEREPGERPAFLSEACGGDEALLQEVQSLLGYGEAAGAFLERPALEDEAQRIRHEPAPLLVERQIDEYRILSLLGEGGMGQVYRAKDLTLGREVAIKVLQRSAARDPEDLRRFEAEARLASVLNHPNIVTIYGVGEKDELAYIAMELVHGRTLRELLSGTPLSMKVCLDLAAQLADALSFAHAGGIIHRDLKPENIMVTPAGRLKVLDFGIAKLQGPGENGTQSGTAVLTEDGKILGTVGYMSPEQAAGKRAVPASDQFSLGTILYEMVTGRQAWKRNTAAETLTAIIREDPAPIASAAPDTPTAMRWIIDRCLTKDPEERYGSTRDLARDLAMLRDHLGELRGADPSAERTGTIAPRPRGRRILLVAAACAAAVGAAIFLSPPIRRPPSPDWTRIGFRRGIVWSGRFTPDGQTIVYSAAWDGDPSRIYSTRAGSTETRTLDLPPGKLLAISPRSELGFLRDVRINTFFSQQGTLVRAGLEGGVGRDILENVQAADWSPDGTQLAVAREVAGKVRLEYPLGKTLYEGDQRIGSIRISRDGAWIAFCEGGGEATVSALRVSDGQKRVLSEGWFPGAMGLAWSADGREIWFTPQKQVRDSSPPLLAVTLSGERREVVRGPGQLRLYDIAADGRVLLARWDLQLGVRGASPTSSQERELSVTDDSLLADLSGDGSAVLLYDRDGLFLRRTDGSPSLRVSDRFDGGRLSPDGKWVLAMDSYPMLIPVGAGEVRTIGTQECWGVEWFPDGKRILCEVTEPAGKVHLFVLDLPSGKASEVPLSEDAAADLDILGPLSPDGAFLAGVGHSRDYWIVPLAGGASRRIAASDVSVDGDTLPVGWTADGRRLFVTHPGQVPNRVQRFDLATGRIEPWKELTLEDRAGITRIGPVRVAADGRSWAYSYVRVLSNLYVVEGLK
jgi:Tol biopolymer transport system component/predicted Ser/Thr protein kinase